MTTVNEKLARRRELLDTIYTLLDTENENRDYDMKGIAQVLGLNVHTARDYLAEFEDLGIISRRYQYGGKAAGMSVGRHYSLWFHMSLDEARKVLDADDEQRLEHQKAVFEATGKRMREASIQRKEPTRVVQLEDRKVMSAANIQDALDRIGGSALIAEARAYRESTYRVRAKLDELRILAQELDMPLDMTLLAEAIGAPMVVDERLDAICEVLPYIEALERKVEAMTEMLNAATAKVAQG